VARIPQVDETTFGDNIFPFEKRLGEARGFAVFAGFDAMNHGISQNSMGFVQGLFHGIS